MEGVNGMWYCGSSVVYYPIRVDKSNLRSPVGIALSRHFAYSSGIEACSYLFSVLGVQSSTERKIISREC